MNKDERLLSVLTNINCMIELLEADMAKVGSNTELLAPHLESMHNLRDRYLKEIGETLQPTIKNVDGGVDES